MRTTTITAEQTAERKASLIRTRAISSDTSDGYETIQDFFRSLECDVLTRIINIDIVNNHAYINYAGEYDFNTHSVISKYFDETDKVLFIKYRDIIWINKMSIDIRINVTKYPDTVYTEIETYKIMLLATSQYNGTELKCNMQRYLLLLDNSPMIAKYCQVVTPKKMYCEHFHKTYKELSEDMAVIDDKFIKAQDWRIITLHWYKTMRMRGNIKLKDITPHNLFFSRY